MKTVELIQQETKLVKLICKQFTSKEIAKKMDLGHRTVEDYRRKIIKKIRAKNTAGIVIYAVKNGMYKI
jgi:DNA-binding CsgD family transcriptional regulator